MTESNAIHMPFPGNFSDAGGNSSGKPAVSPAAEAFLALEKKEPVSDDENAAENSSQTIQTEPLQNNDLSTSPASEEAPTSNFPDQENKQNTSSFLPSVQQKASTFLAKAKSLAPMKALKSVFHKKNDFLSGAKTPEEAPGNAFTRIFGSEKKKESGQEGIIENIISQGSKPAGQSREDQKELIDWRNPKEAKKVFTAQEQKKQHAAEQFRLAKVAVTAALAVPFFSFLFGQLFLSTDGIFSSVFAEKNYALVLQSKQGQLQALQTDIGLKEKEIEAYVKKIDDIENNKVLGEIADTRINWREIYETILTVTNRTFEGNEFSHYVTYTNYTGKSPQGQSADPNQVRISIQGQVRNVVGSTWADLVKLKEALNTHPHFSGVEISQFTKQPTNRSAVIRENEYVSPFSFDFFYLRTPEALQPPVAL